MSATASQSAASRSRSSTPRVVSVDSIAGTSSSSMAASSLRVEVEGELGRVRAEPHDVDLVLALVVDPGADQLLAEDAALRQERVVGLERVERLAERPRHLRDVAVGLLEEIVVGRRARVEAALEAVGPSQPSGREGQG